MTSYLSAKDLNESKFTFTNSSPFKIYALLLSYELHQRNPKVCLVYGTDLTVPGEKFSFQTYPERFNPSKDFLIPDHEVFFVETYLDNGITTLRNDLVRVSRLNPSDVPVPSTTPTDSLKREFVICEMDCIGKVYRNSLELQKGRFKVLSSDDCAYRIRMNDKHFINLMKRIDKKVPSIHKISLEKKIGFSRLMAKISQPKKRDVEVGGSDLLGYQPTQTIKQPPLSPDLQVADSNISSEEEDNYQDASDMLPPSYTKMENPSRDREQIIKNPDEDYKRAMQNQLISGADHPASIKPESFKAFTQRASFRSIIGNSNLEGHFLVNLRFIGYEPYGSEVPFDESSPYTISPSIKLYFVDGSSKNPNEVSGLLTEYLAINFDNYKPLMKLFGISNIHSAVYGEEGGLSELLKEMSRRHKSSDLKITNVGTGNIPRWTILEENAEFLRL